MTIEFLKSLSISEIFKLDNAIFYQGCKWDYEFIEELFDKDYYDDDDDDGNQYYWEEVLNLIWLEKGEKNFCTLYYFEREDLITIDDYTIIYDEMLSDIYIFDNNLMCDGVLDGFFDFNDYEITLTRRIKQK